MAYPSEYRYTNEHEWIHADGQEATIGITDFAQQQLGDIVFVELPREGSQLKAGEALGTVESVKAVSEVFSPVTGTITKVNPALAQQPELVNSDPHGGAWLVKVRLSQPDELKKLMDAGQYQKFIAEEKG